MSQRVCKIIVRRSTRTRCSSADPTRAVQIDACSTSSGALVCLTCYYEDASTGACLVRHGVSLSTPRQGALVHSLHACVYVALAHALCGCTGYIAKILVSEGESAAVGSAVAFLAASKDDIAKVPVPSVAFQCVAGMRHHGHTWKDVF